MCEQQMDWKTLLTPERLTKKNKKRDKKKNVEEEVRSAFQQDIDRIIFSDPFHRLARKTQVHPLNENDHIHSRLTHSLETSCVGRSLGEKAGRFLQENGELPENMHPFHVGQIVQAACLAHDIGNPPFGHSGETAIKSWFKKNHVTIKHLDHDCQSDFTKFDGNAMSFRIAVSTGFNGQGMGLTYPVLGALLKYPWPSCYDCGKDKFSYFQSESEEVKKLAAKLNLIQTGSKYARHPLAFLTEAADDICYRIIDIEDATEMNILANDFMMEKLISVLEIEPKNIENIKQMSFRPRNSKIRAHLVYQSINEIIETFKLNYNEIMTGKFDCSSSLMEKSEGRTCKSVYKTYNNITKKLFLSRRKAILEIGAQNSIGALLDEIMGEVLHFCTETPSDGKDKIEILLGEDIVLKIKENPSSCRYQIAMAALDYVTGMTDHYATEICRKFLGFGC